jgi:Protein of unknown function (DUF3500)
VRGFIPMLTIAAGLALAPIAACDAQGPRGGFSGGRGGEQVDLQISRAIKVQPADAKANAIVAAADAFLATLNAAQRKSVLYAFDDNVQRARWSNLPIGSVPRGGIMREQLSAAQNAALERLLGEVLSEDGVRNARLQMAADDALTNNGGRMQFGSGFYYVAFVGTPSVAQPWMFQFGGHHLAVNVTFAGPQASFSPMLTGGQPMRLNYQGQSIYIAQAEIDAADALLRSLNAAQKTAAILGDRPINLLLGPGAHGASVANEGVRGADLTAAQKELLLKVVQARVGQFNARDAQAKMAVVRKDIDITYFGWWGPQGTPGAAYYRITGPELSLEFAPQTFQAGDATDHAHNMYRDPKNDYGAAWIGAHP